MAKRTFHFLLWFPHFVLNEKYPEWFSRTLSNDSDQNMLAKYQDRIFQCVPGNNFPAPNSVCDGFHSLDGWQCRWLCEYEQARSDACVENIEKYFYSIFLILSKGTKCIQMAIEKSERNSREWEKIGINYVIKCHYILDSFAPSLRYWITAVYHRQPACISLRPDCVVWFAF